MGMKHKISWAPGPKVRVIGAELRGGRWFVEAEGCGRPACPTCGTLSGSRHSSYSRRLQDLPAQGIPVTVWLRAGRWRCRNPRCAQQVFTERFPGVAAPFAQRTCRVIELVCLIGHAAGGRPGERLMDRFAMPASDDTILRQLKRKQGAEDLPAQSSLRVVGIDDWAWRKGQSYGTILVDLERRTVIDLLPDRSAASAAAWLALHPGIEIVSRDRCGLYADAARRGAPKARQVADRFHLLQNLREAIARQLSRIGRPITAATADSAVPAMCSSTDGQSDGKDQQQIARQARELARQSVFAQVRARYEAGSTVGDIVRDLGLNRKRVYKWIRLETLPARRPMAPKPTSPVAYQTYLASRWAEGCTHGRSLFAEIKRLGYTGCFSYLARFLSPWRRQGPPVPNIQVGAQVAPAPIGLITGPETSPLVAAALGGR